MLWRNIPNAVIIPDSSIFLISFSFEPAFFGFETKLSKLCSGTRAMIAAKRRMPEKKQTFVRLNDIASSASGISSRKIIDSIRPAAKPYHKETAEFREKRNTRKAVESQ